MALTSYKLSFPFLTQFTCPLPCVCPVILVIALIGDKRPTRSCHSEAPRGRFLACSILSMRGRGSPHEYQSVCMGTAPCQALGVVSGALSAPRSPWLWVRGEASPLA